MPRPSAESVMKIVREGRIILVDKECDDTKPFDKSCVLHEIYQRGSNRCFVQCKLYEIYFKPDGISFKDSRLQRLQENCEFMDAWSVKDHNEAVKLMKLAKGMEEFKAYFRTH